MMARIAWGLAAALLACAPGAAAAPGGGFAVLAPAERYAADTPAARAVIVRARAALDRPPGAIPFLHTEGTLPHKGIRDISLKAKQDQPIVLALALAWRLTGDRAYLDQAGRYLDAWATIYHLSLNPIDETGFDSLALAYHLTRADLPAAVRGHVDGFWLAMANGYLNDIARMPRNHGNNWQSHRVKLAAMAAFETGDAALIARARAAYRAQIATNLTRDGSPVDFHERDALHYVTYDFDPLLMAALAAAAHGEDWYRWRGPDGVGLPEALAWLEPYARGGKTHIEFAHSTVQFDRDRARAGQGEYAPHPWDRANAVGTYALAARLDPRWRPLATALRVETGRAPADWLLVTAR